MKKRFLSFMIALFMVIQMVPLQASGDNGYLYNRTDLPETIPPYPAQGQTYWIIFNEGFRDNRLEMSTFNVTGDASGVRIIWNGGLKATCSNGSVSRSNQFVYTPQAWVTIGDYGVLSDKATRVFASNVDVYDSNGNIVFHKSDWVDDGNNVPDDAAFFNGHYYMLYNDASSFDAAQQNCVARGGHLATLTTSSENSFCYNYIVSKDVKSAYFGFTDAEKEGVWKWITGETTSYTNWHSGEPNGENSREDYAMFYYKFTDGTWNDGDFGGSTVNGGTYYICEWEGDGNNVPVEIMHLIFADMSYDLTKNDVRTDSPKTVSEYVSEGHGSPDPLYKNSTFSQRDAFNLVGEWIIKDVDYGNETNEAAGYAAAVFQKGDQIVIAYRGSEDGPLTAFKGEDWTVDFQFALFNYLNPAQFNAAMNTYKKYAGRYSITLTGHSLGGALATYVSIITGTKAYTFDGADGHVVDLTYLSEFKEIDFTSKYDMKFTNYTDPESLTGKIADLIQHTNPDLMYGYCYNTNHDVNLPSSYIAVPTHFIYSNTRLVNGIPAFTELAERHTPKGNWYASIDFTYLGMLVGGVGGFLSGGLNGMIQTGKTGGNIGRLFKKGNVIIGTSGNDRLTVNAAIRNPLDLTAHYTVNAIYGGDGRDELCGSFGNDILVSGRLAGDLLVGSEGRDTYVLDGTNGGTVFIADLADGNVIHLKGSDFIATKNVKYMGKDGKYHVFSVNDSVTISILHTWMDHDFVLTDMTGSEICTLTSHGLVKFSGGGSGSGGGRSARRSISEEVSTRNVTITDASEVKIYDENDNLLGTFSIENSGLYCEEYGVILVHDNVINAAIYDSCTLQAKGNGETDFYIVGSDSEGNVLQTAIASDVNLNLGTALVEPREYTISQNKEAVTTEQLQSSTGVHLNTSSMAIQMGESAALNAQIEFANGAGTSNVSWVNSNPNVIAFEYDEYGNCTINAISCGTATMTAIAEDSGRYAECVINVTCKGGITCPGNSFSDMPIKKNWAHDPIDWAVVNKITAGTSSTTFSPNDTCTRGQIVTFLWRAAGSPEPKTTNNPFIDVKPGKYYYKPVLWAVEQGITSGTTETTFGPNDGCTRGQVVTFLWRYAGSPKPEAENNPFTDVKSGKYYYKPVLWALENGITSGTSPMTFGTDDVCTRAQIVTFLYRYMVG